MTLSTTKPPGQKTLTRKMVFLGALPIMLANAGAPIVGFVDTWVVGNYIGREALAGIGLGAVIFGVFYWGFGFLRMSTAGLSAQADGAGDQQSVQAHLFRAVPMGFAIGLVIFLLQGFLVNGIMQFFPAETVVADGARDYLHARLWGLPATLSSIALMGWFIGLSRPGRALQMQIVLNLINAPLSVLFVVKFNWGLSGAGFASAIAEWCGLLAGLILAVGEIKSRGGFDRLARRLEVLLDMEALKKLATANSNIFIRTLALTLGFTFFARAATDQGTTFLAAHTVLMQFITLVALVLDSFAHVAEARVGSAYGARDKKRFDRAVRLTTELSFIFALLCGLAIYVFGPLIIDQLTTDIAVRATARLYLPYCALTPIVGFAAWQLDGIFIGITRTAAMRNAGIVAVLIYFLAHYMLEPKFGGAGVWLAFLVYYVARALTMLPAWPNIRRELLSSVSGEHTLK
ncbi:MAG: MATE family efflux transporter [Robiginitomaculum sp.]|nr:MAG: MATE family efflux transporter [Robiginitomaculum sp.]